MALSLWEKGLFPVFEILTLLHRHSASTSPARIPFLVPARRRSFRRPVARGNILLVGDAAGFVDPFSGEGIYWAINSGITAAKLTAAYLAGNLQGSLAHAYSRECRQRWQQEFRLSLLLALLAGRKDLFFRFLKHNPGAMALFPTVMQDPNCYRNLFRTALPRLPRLLARTLLGGL